MTIQRLLRTTFRRSLLLSLLGLISSVQAHPDHPLRHWVRASPDPDRIVLTWTDDPATSQAVTWRTDDSVTEAHAEIALARPEANFDQQAKRTGAKTESLELALPGVTVHYHSVVFEDLKPETLYAYRVGSGERWSEWIQFKTASLEDKPFTFLYFGDGQNSVLSHWSRIIRAAYAEAPHASFSVHAGDLINLAHKDQEWAEWFKAGGWIHASVPSVPVPGNHEYGGLSRNGKNEGRKLAIQWRRQFTLPVVDELPEELAETVYTMTYQGVRVIALNSNRDVGVQAKWLDKVLSQNTSKWTVVTQHHPIFSSGGTRDNAANRALLKPILEKHQVDLVLQGHDHTYARGHTPVRMSEGESDEAEINSLYVNSVSGPKMYQFREGGWKVYERDGVVLDRKAEGTPFFQVIDVKGDWLRYRAFMANGEVYDSVRLQKLPDGSKKLHRDPEASGEEKTLSGS